MTPKAFNWQTEFPQVFANGGFDVVVGNPPYVKEYEHKKAFENLKNSDYYEGKMDLWQFFVCNGLNLLKDNSYLSFISPNNWITNHGAKIIKIILILKDGKLLWKMLDIHCLPHLLWKEF